MRGERPSKAADLFQHPFAPFHDASYPAARLTKLWGSFENHNWLVRAWDNRFGNGDQLLLAIENTEARGLPVAGVEFRRRALRGGGMAGLNLRDENIEFRAVAHAALDNGQDGDARQFGQQGFKANHALGKTPGTCRFRQFL